MAATDVITIEGLRVSAFVGVHPHEALARQPLLIDVTLYADLQAAGHSDHIGRTIDYQRAANLVAEVVARKHHKLIESVAEDVAAALLAELPDRLERARVRVEKPNAIPEAHAVAVVIERSRGNPVVTP